jgi:hypothetical protein
MYPLVLNCDGVIPSLLSTSLQPRIPVSERRASFDPSREMSHWIWIENSHEPNTEAKHLVVSDCYLPSVHARGFSGDFQCPDAQR